MGRGVGRVVRRQDGGDPCGRDRARPSRGDGGARRLAEPRTAGGGGTPPLPREGGRVVGRRPPRGGRGSLYAFAILAIRAFAHVTASSTVGRTGRLSFCTE